ncbi:hypothetical protein DEIPH_ctg023orf0036 [Deinococcus phoenicis]|uniref:Uncharacterized protein n=1 Tax=Deinococcus phoenicis TaxID=1476583 RepID=A0A016QRC4_9DEIO|nr:hypothetical protein [Deinococcus phoenicis]EYB68447.1 hypothetical protein DEIPH_ctg023orf0036 [Deinococcus phoenicis]
MALPLLLLPGLLCGCQDREARAENARLAARVTALEAQIGALAAQARTERRTRADADSVVRQAAAQNCANDLARFLESLRQDVGTYPAMRLVTLPDSCVDLRVNWRTLKPEAYAFDVLDKGGEVLATGRGP